MKTVGFVILHYNNIETTKNSIKYIENFQNDNIRKIIVIVDNKSTNNSGILLEREYKKNKNIFVLLMKNNVGFANGNNYGYIFLKEKIKHIEYIVIMNSDVYIKDKYFLNKLFKSNNNSEIIAPKILNQLNINQNPFRTKKLSTFKVFVILVYNLYIFALLKIKIFNFIFSKKINEHKEIKRDTNTNKIYNIVPHGSCIIYTSKWIEKENIAFIPNTFMFMEEDFLFDYIEEKQYQLFYDEEIVVWHLEDASINMNTNNYIDKKLFISKCMIDSSRKLLIERLKWKN